jgi:hypothetical protein
MFTEELESLSNGSMDNIFYSKHREELVEVHAELLASLADQPERRSANNLMNGNGRFAGRMGHSIDLTSLAASIEPCAECYKNICDKGDGFWASNSTCEKCTKWTMMGDHQLLRFPPPADYPLDRIPEGGFLFPAKLTYESLKEAVDLTHTMVSTGKWSGKNGSAYLATYTIAPLYSEQVIVNADNVRCLSEARNNTNTLKCALESLEELAAADPETFQPKDLPALWERGLSETNPVPLEKAVDVPMHLLFLGVVKTVTKTIQEWCKVRGTQSAFVRSVKGLLKGIKKFNLDWCKTIEYSGGKLGGWVSENYLGFIRVASWFYMQLENLAPDVTYEEPKDKPLSKWTMDETKGWLRARGLKLDGKAKDLKERIRVLCDAKEGPPELIGQKGGSFDHVKKCLLSLIEMIQVGMTTAVDKSVCDLMEYKIKSFLTHFAKLDGEVNPKRDKPTWVTSYNFSSLLNLPGIMARYGPLRNLWEGGNQGEGILKYVKQEITMGLRPGWQNKLMTRMMRRKALRSLMDNDWSEDMANKNACDDDYHEKEDKLPTSKNSYFEYRSEYAVRQDFALGRQLSGVWMSNGTGRIILKKGKSLEITRIQNTGRNLYGLCYHQWNLVAGVIDSDQTSAVVPCIFLPERKTSEEDLKQGGYTLIRKDWKMIGQNGNFERFGNS